MAYLELKVVGICSSRKVVDQAADDDGTDNHGCEGDDSDHLNASLLSMSNLHVSLLIRGSLTAFAVKVGGRMFRSNAQGLDVVVIMIFDNDDIHLHVRIG